MILALCGQKGGSGKSTAALAIACELQERGERVLLVDGDPQGSARAFGQVAAEFGYEAPTIVGMGADLHRPHQLPALAGDFAHVVLDTPPRLAEVQRAALMVAELAVLPCGPSGLDAWSLGESLELVRAAQNVHPALVACVLLARKVSGTVLARGAREALAECGLPILKGELGFRIAFQEAPAAGLGVTRYAPTSEAAGEVRALVDELLTLAAQRPRRKRHA